MNETSNGAVLSAIEISSANAAGEPNPTVDLALSIDNGGTYSTIAAGLAMDRFGRASPIELDEDLLDDLTPDCG